MSKQEVFAEVAAILNKHGYLIDSHSLNCYGKLTLEILIPVDADTSNDKELNDNELAEISAAGKGDIPNPITSVKAISINGRTWYETTFKNGKTEIYANKPNGW